MRFLTRKKEVRKQGRWAEGMKGWEGAVHTQVHFHRFPAGAKQRQEPATEGDCMDLRPRRGNTDDSV